ncbi:MAG: TonB family protein [Pseudomonadota bacterium]|nr:TonB family protein [Pseudomonadota bacterium]
MPHVGAIALLSTFLLAAHPSGAYRGEKPVAAVSPATSVSALPRTVEPARAPASLASYVSPDDYPTSALRNREQGTTRFRLTVGADGRVTDCTITGSSGSAALDSATCRIMRSRARFTPARDSNGNPTSDTVGASLTWRIPAPAPLPPPVEPAITLDPQSDIRHWVQVGGGPNRSALPDEARRLRRQAPELLGSRYFWVVGLNATNRLVVGPFSSEADAQAFVNQLAERQLRAFVWFMPEGAVIEPVGE